MSQRDSEEIVRVEMTRGEWDVVIHALEEEMAQLVPESEWLGYAPGEEGAVAIGEAHENIMRAVIDSSEEGSS